MVVKLSFDEFIDTYNSPKTIASSRSVVPLVNNDVLMELYSYELLMDDDTIVTHPDYTEAGFGPYMIFLLDMRQAFEDKKPN